MAFKMTGLSATERSGCEKLLRLLSNGDLLLLCDTVTNKLITVETVAEAMEAILSYSKDAEELLKRKKVYRDIIFKYLAKEGVAMPPTSEKHALVKKTLELWSSGTSCRTTTENTEFEAGFDSMALGKQFCQWFFQLLNSQNPSLDQQHQDWGPQHFWSDVKLGLLSSTDRHHVEEFQGSELVSQRLLALAKEEQLHFSPNLEHHGLRTLSSPHGLVLVAVAGTIHRATSCLGIFEQVFGLIRSPLDSRWKIKFVHLKIRGQNSLNGTDMASPTLTYDSSELQLMCS